MVGVQLSQVGAAAEDRRRHGLKQDLRCPITLEVMADPVIASDGHSYEREAIQRWFQTHRTSPLTGRVMPNQDLIPNHRLRTLIQDMLQDMVSAAAGSPTVHRPSPGLGEPGGLVSDARLPPPPAATGRSGGASPVL